MALALDALFACCRNSTKSPATDIVRHIVPATILSVLFVAAGVSFRTGWLY
jgi:hypothetical protein